MTMKNRILSLGAAGAVATTALLGAAAPANAASLQTWEKIAACESSNTWDIDTGNRFYGGLQFTQSSWEAVGGTGNPADASKAEQIARAEKLQDMQGWGAWPVCSKKAGLSGADTAPPAYTLDQLVRTSVTTPVTKPTAKPAPAPVTKPTAKPAPAPVTKPTAKPAPATSGTITVSAGDSLWSLAREHGLEGGWPALAAANPQVSGPRYLLSIGQVLNLPGNDAVEDTGEHAKTKTKTVVVRAGDFLWKIAQRESIAGGWRALATANASVLDANHTIYPGQKLMLP